MAPKTTYIIFPKKATNTPVGQEKVDGLDKLSVLLVRGQVGQSKADHSFVLFLCFWLFSLCFFVKISQHFGFTLDTNSGLTGQSPWVVRCSTYKNTFQCCFEVNCNSTAASLDNYFYNYKDLPSQIGTWLDHLFSIQVLVSTLLIIWYLQWTVRIKLTILRWKHHQSETPILHFVFSPFNQPFKNNRTMLMPTYHIWYLKAVYNIMNV